MKVEFRHATLADVQQYAGKLPPMGARIWAGFIDGKVVALGGYSYAPNGGVVAFLDADDVVREKAKFTLMKAARTVLKAAAAQGVREITACASLDIAAARPFLERLGFRSVDDRTRVYLYVV